MQLLIHRASALTLLEDEQKFKLGGVLTAIISHFECQLIGNKISFTPCSIHILLISNKFHKFWMSCAFRRQYTKNEPKLGKTQAGRPSTSTYPAIFSIQEQSDTQSIYWAICMITFLYLCFHMLVFECSTAISMMPKRKLHHSLFSEFHNLRLSIYDLNMLGMLALSLVLCYA